MTAVPARAPAAVPLATTAPSATTAPPGSAATTAGVPAGAAACPTLAQAEAALAASYSGPKRTPAGGGGIVCEYIGAAGRGNAGVAIFAYQTAAVFAGQVANAGTAPGMQKISGVGDTAFGVSTDGRSIVNACSDASRTVVAAQAPGPLAQAEALARVALADN